MVHEGAVEDILEKWRAWVGAMMGGVHLCRVGAVPPRPHNLNYLRKIFSALAISRRRAYSTIISLDDDILLAPDAILALLEHAPAAVAGPAARCAMVSPTISNGIPTAELLLRMRGVEVAARPWLYPRAEFADTDIMHG